MQHCMMTSTAAGSVTPLSSNYDAATPGPECIIIIIFYFSTTETGFARTRCV